jgi:hypothetical protein
LQLSCTSRFSKGEGDSSLQTPLTREDGITDRWQSEFEWNAISRHTETGEATPRGKGGLTSGTNVSSGNTLVRTDPNSSKSQSIWPLQNEATPPVPSEGRLARWFELQTATVSGLDCAQS